MALTNFQILSPEQANPLYNALQNAMQMQKTRQQGIETQFLNPLLVQQLKQQMIKTGFAPDTAASQIAANYSGPFSSALEHWAQGGKKKVKSDTVFGGINSAIRNANQLAQTYDQSGQGQNNSGGQNNASWDNKSGTPTEFQQWNYSNKEDATARPDMGSPNDAKFDINSYSGSFKKVPASIQIQIMNSLPTQAEPVAIHNGILYFYLNGKKKQVSVSAQ